MKRPENAVGWNVVQVRTMESETGNSDVKVMSLYEKMKNKCVFKNVSSVSSVKKTVTIQKIVKIKPQKLKLVCFQLTFCDGSLS